MQGRRECLISRFAFYYMYGHLHGMILHAAKLFSPESVHVIDLKWYLLICQVSFWLCGVCAYVKHEICQGSMICKPQTHVSALIKMTHWLFMIRETERVLPLPAERRVVMVTGGSGEVAQGGRQTGGAHLAVINLLFCGREQPRLGAVGNVS